MEQTKISILLADDHQMMIDGVKDILGKEDGLIVAAEANLAALENQPA